MKYDIPDTAKGWAFEIIWENWKNHRSGIKEVCYEPYEIIKFDCLKGLKIFNNSI